MGFSGTPNNGTCLWYAYGMGIVWEAYHKQVPLLGVPGITLDMGFSASFSASLGLVMFFLSRLNFFFGTQLQIQYVYIHMYIYICICMCIYTLYKYILSVFKILYTVH